MLLIGLTGGIATGKTTVAQMMREMGVPIVDADALARRVVEPGQPAYHRIVREFGNDILIAPSGPIDREQLGRIIFADPDARRRLNGCTHPAIRWEMLKLVAWHWLRATPVLVLDVPLLFESKLDRYVHLAVTVYCPPEQEKRRLMKRNELDEASAQQRIDAQMPISEKCKRAQVVIRNDKSLAWTREQVQALLKREWPSPLRVWLFSDSHLHVVSASIFSDGEPALFRRFPLFNFFFMRMVECIYETLVPPVQSFSLHGGVWQCTDTATLTIICTAGDLLTAEFLRDSIDSRIRIQTTSDIKGHAIVLTATSVNVNVTNAPEHEAYTLLVECSGIVMSASAPAGLMHAVNTLRQCLDGCNGFVLPCALIQDSPRFGWRGCMLDSSRHYQSPDFIINFLEAMAYHKMNRFHWHLCDDQGWRFPVPSWPLLTQIGSHRLEDSHGGHYTESDIQRIVERARALQITIVPEIELPGHCMAALASYPHLGCTRSIRNVPSAWGIYEDVYCAGREETFRFLHDVFQQVCALFPHSPYIHIGGDEVPKTRWRSCPDCQQRMRQEGLESEDELQCWFVRRIVSMLNAMNRQIIGWDEILEGGKLDEGTTIVQSWRGHSGGAEAARHGLCAVMSPTSHCYFDFPLSTRVYDFDPIPKELEPSLYHLILGGECCMWTERAPEHQVMGKVFPRLLALASVLWMTPETKRQWPFDRFHSVVTAVHIPRRLPRLGIRCLDGLAKAPRMRYAGTVKTSIGVFENYYPEHALDGDLTTFYWSNRSAVKGDAFEFNYATPIDGQGMASVSVRVRTGKTMAPHQDWLRHGAVDVCCGADKQWRTIGEIRQNDATASGVVPSPIHAVCVKIMSSQEEWLVIRDISILSYRLQISDGHLRKNQQ